jgi:Tfp pilus assembly protein FimT
MRQLNRGFTLIEAMVIITIVVLLILAGLPSLSSFLANAKLRDGAATFAATINTARNEAVRRNCSVSITPMYSAVTLAKGANCPASLLSARASGLPKVVALPDRLQVVLKTADGTIVPRAVLNSMGQVVPFGVAYQADMVLDGHACIDDVRCSAVIVEAGGAANICAKGALNGVCL